ncbi:ATP-binding cassette domain-containing protein [Streptomyces sp. NPDC059063]|uniref:ATP-binding cassette domain-containing protein n=1 Tax=unclassified Streptomyces TaxID=2593676 RepID=UPI00368BE4BE
MDHPHQAAEAISVQDLSRRYGDREAVRGITFDVAVGETFGLLGPNGAGKWTTIGMLSTLLRPTGVLARVAGLDVLTQCDLVRANIGLVFEDLTLDGYLTAEQHLRFHAELYGMPKDGVAQRILQMLEMVDLWE